MNDSSTSTTPPPPPSPLEAPNGHVCRRSFIQTVCISLGGICAALVGLPLVGFIFAPLFRKSPEPWLKVGKVTDYQVGTTVNVTIQDPSPLPWAGITARSGAWLRRVSDTEFIAFSVNCTHLGCPVRWLPDAQLFMCPCHGGVYYNDGTVAAGPPPHPLTRYDVRVQDGVVEIKAAPIPITTA